MPECFSPLQPPPLCLEPCLHPVPCLPLPCPGNDLHQDLRTIKLLRQGCKARGAPTPPLGFPHPSPGLPQPFRMLLRHFQALIGHGEARDKLDLGTTTPEGFGTARRSSSRNSFPSMGDRPPDRVPIPGLPGELRGFRRSPTPPAALSGAHAPLPSTTFGFSPAMTSPSHSRSSSSTFVTGSREMSLQVRSDPGAVTRRGMSSRDRDSSPHRTAPQPLRAASRNQGVTPSPVIQPTFWRILGENKPVLQPSEDSRVCSVLDYKALPSSSCFQPENLLINPLPC